MRRLAWAAAFLAAACGQADIGGGGGDVPGSGSVSGTALGRDFTFTPQEVGAVLRSNTDGTAALSIVLCDGACTALGAAPASASVRVVLLTVTAATAELRAGGTFAVPGIAQGVARVQQGMSGTSDPARGGEVVIAETDLRVGGSTSGTFQLALDSGGTLSGFFDAPIVGDSAVVP